jgi:ABC-type lipoprotein release transport system permease subunit
VFRYFLSRRYLLHRRTNLIGIVGILVAVGALIMILSIMTGFLEQTKKSIRGSLADLIIRPRTVDRSGLRRLPSDPAEVLTLIRSDPRVKAASAHLVWFCMIARGGAEAAMSQRMLSDSLYGDLNAVELVGVDTQDEFATTEFSRALEREPKLGAASPTPRSRSRRCPTAGPEGIPRASAVIGEQLYSALGLSRGDEITVATVVPDPKTGRHRALQPHVRRRRHVPHASQRHRPRSHLRRAQRARRLPRLRSALQRAPGDAERLRQGRRGGARRALREAAQGGFPLRPARRGAHWEEFRKTLLARSRTSAG